MRYKVGDVVKLRDDLKEGIEIGDYYYSYKMADFRGEKVTIVEIDEKEKHYSIEEDCKLHYWTDEMIEGLWEECKPKLKLIDILNKIANGELKEGTKVIYLGVELVYKNERLVDYEGCLFTYLMRDMSDLNIEAELIEPECNHEWEEQVVRNGIGEIIKRFRKCVKCQEYVIIGNTLEPTDNTTEKIEELKQLDMDFAEIDFASHEEYARCSIQVLAREMIKQIDKLNEVISKINKED